MLLFTYFIYYNTNSTIAKFILLVPLWRIFQNRVTSTPNKKVGTQNFTAATVFEQDATALPPFAVKLFPHSDSESSCRGKCLLKRRTLFCHADVDDLLTYTVLACARIVVTLTMETLPAVNFLYSNINDVRLTLAMVKTLL